MNFSKLFVVVGAAASLSACDSYDPYHPDTKDLEGVWGDDNENSRLAEEMPVSREVRVYATHAEYMGGNGTYGTEGEWRDGGFWCYIKGTSDEIEAVKPVGPEEVEVRVSGFAPGSTEVYRLYKEQGSDEEMAAIQQSINAKYPSIAYPPPYGAIFVGMTEFQLKCLPWKPTRDDAVVNEKLGKFETPLPEDVHATYYFYHSDNKQLSELRVTVKDHQVIALQGGNQW